MEHIIAETNLQVPVSWVLASGATLAGAISFLAKLIYASQQKQIDILRDEIKEMREVSRMRSKMIEDQNTLIHKLQDQISDMIDALANSKCKKCQNAIIP
jgi:hypothetical protein